MRTPKMVDFDSPEIYTLDEIHSLIQEEGIERAIHRIDVNKVPDPKLRILLDQFESIATKITNRVSPDKVVING